VGNADSAMDIVTFDPKFANVMQLLFQDWFLCEDEETARKLSTRRNGQNAYNCITLKGDQYKADGLISGGDTSRSVGNRVLDIQQYLSQEQSEKSSN
jgi:chromosome segregation ATPase